MNKWMIWEVLPLFLETPIFKTHPTNFNKFLAVHLDRVKPFWTSGGAREFFCLTNRPTPGNPGNHPGKDERRQQEIDMIQKDGFAEMAIFGMKWQHISSWWLNQTI